MKQKIVTTKINGIGEISISICQTSQSWWLQEIEQFITHSEGSFITIASLNKKFHSNIELQNAIQNFINHIQKGGEPQAANKIRNHFNNWLNKTNGTIGTQSGINPNGSGLSGSNIIRPDKSFETTF